MKRLIYKSVILAGLVTMAACETVEPVKLETYTVEHIGTATVLLNYGRLTILTDPAFDKAGSSYPFGPNTLEKLTDPARPVSELPDIDLVLLSHDQHPDNLDDTGRTILESTDLTITTREGAARLKANTAGLAPGESRTIRGVTITAVPAQHGPAQAVGRLGTVIGFIISSPAGPTIYISGDTVPFSGTQEIVELYAGEIDYALLHTGSVAQGTDNPTYFTMTAADAVALAEVLDVKAFSIIHADSWSHFRERLPAALDVVRSSAVSNRVVDLTNSRVHTIQAD